MLQGHTSLVGQLQLSGDTLVTGGSDGRVIAFNLATNTCIHRLCAHDNSVTCLQFDERFIISGGNDGRIKLWDFRTGAFVRELSRTGDAVWRVAFRDDQCVVLLQREGKTVLEVISFRPE
jgi:F-box and WD-40 domain protein CDC4